MKHKPSRGIQEKLHNEGILSLILRHKKNKNILDFLSRSNKTVFHQLQMYFVWPT